jgi:hypothetical protein
MGPIKAFKLFEIYRRFEAIQKENVSMQVKSPQLIHLIVTLAGLFGAGAIAQHFLDGHLIAVQIVVGLLVVGHAIAPSIIPDPSDAAKKAAGLGVLLLCLLLAPHASAQVAPATNATVDVQNIYAGGISYSINATPAIAGTALYAHAINASGTYAFSVIDALPNTIKPFTVTSNIGAGIAQRVVTIGKIPVFVPTSAGISWQGSNVGWQWNGGALASIHLKGSYYLMPSVRFLKSSVSNGSGYQPIVGVLFAWGQ